MGVGIQSKCSVMACVTGCVGRAGVYTGSSPSSILRRQGRKKKFMGDLKGEQNVARCRGEVRLAKKGEG